VSYKGKDPVRVKEIVENLTNLFIEENLTAKRSEAYEAYDFLNDQLQTYKKKLEESEKALREFKEANLKDLQYKISSIQPDGLPKEGQPGGPMVGGVLGAGAQNANMIKLEQAQGELADLETSIRAANLKLELLRKQLAVEEPVVITASETTTNPIGIKLNELEGQLTALLRRYTEQHPDVIRLKREIENIKKQLNVESGGNTGGWGTGQVNPVYQHLTEEIGNVEFEVQALEKRRGELQKKVNEYAIKVKTIPTVEQEYIRLTRDNRVNDELYQMLLRRLEEARISRELEVKEKRGTFKIIEPAIVPLQPSTPGKSIVILIGLLGGIGFGLGVVGLMEIIYRPFIDQNEVEAYLGVPSLGVIPKIFIEEDTKRRKRSNRLMVALCGLYVLLTGAAVVTQNLYQNPAYVQGLMQKYQNLPGFMKEMAGSLKKTSFKQESKP
jgi:uncharacterized protein involved in exopolysaccharide biosynthesis